MASLSPLCLISFLKSGPEGLMSEWTPTCSSSTIFPLISPFHWSHCLFSAPPTHHLPRGWNLGITIILRIPPFLLISISIQLLLLLQPLPNLFSFPATTLVMAPCPILAEIIMATLHLLLPHKLAQILVPSCQALVWKHPKRLFNPLCQFHAHTLIWTWRLCTSPRLHSDFTSALRLQHFLLFPDTRPANGTTCLYYNLAFSPCYFCLGYLSSFCALFFHEVGPGTPV